MENLRSSSAFFYQNNYLGVELSGSTVRTLFRHEGLPLAEQLGKSGATTLLGTDQKSSVLRESSSETRNLFYDSYGQSPLPNSTHSLLGFNGEARQQLTGVYLLGNGYRAYNPALKRFHSPDSLSPFGEGGMNVYAYCEGDPVNLTDPSGHGPYMAWQKSRPRSLPLKTRPSPPPKGAINLNIRQALTRRSLQKDSHGAILKFPKDNFETVKKVLNKTTSLPDEKFNKPFIYRNHLIATIELLAYEASIDIPSPLLTASLNKIKLSDRYEVYEAAKQSRFIRNGNYTPPETSLRGSNDAP